MRGGSEKGIERETSSKAKKNVDGTERGRKRRKGRTMRRERTKKILVKRQSERGQKDGMKN